MSRSTKIALVLVLLPGCSASQQLIRSSSPASLGDASSVEPWEALGRPEFLHSVAQLASAVPSEAGACPRITREGSTTVVKGDCVDDAGKRHTGWARMTTQGGRVHARLHGYGDQELRMTGVARLWNEGPPRYELSLEIQSKDPLDELAPGAHWLALDSRGQRDVDGRWSAQGRLAAEGRGTVRVRTHDLWFDEARCKTEPMGGTTELRSAGRRVEIRYDGATDCDPEGTARWWLDGVDQGELVGIPGESSCSVARRPSGGLLALLLPWLVAARRRRSRTPTTIAASHGHHPPPPREAVVQAQPLPPSLG